MPFNKSALGSVAAAAFLLASGTANAATDPTGVWMNDTGRGAVEIKPCGAGLCGHVVWVKDTTDAKGCGRQIIGDAMPSGDGLWDNGWIYSPEKKKKYDVELKPLDNGTLRVKGYAGTKFFSKTMIWTKAPADLVRCGTIEAAAPAAKPVETAQPSATSPAKTAAATKPKAADTTAKSAAPAARTSAPAPEAAAPAEPEQEIASDESAAEGGPDISEALGKFLKKGPNGTCKLDTPWIQVDFKCEK